MRARIFASLWLDGEADDDPANAVPVEYVTLVLCRDVYHCLPSQLRKEPLTPVLKHLTCIDIEAKVRSMKE